MRKSVRAGLSIASFVVTSAFPFIATAGPQTVFFDTLDASATIVPTVSAGDTVFLDALVTSQTGAFSQSVTFTLGAGVNAFAGQAAWAVTGAAAGPRLVGVNVDLVNVANNAVVQSDSFVGLLGGFARSIIAADIEPGVYKLVATGTGIRDSLINVSLGFTGAVPLPGAASTGSLPAQGVAVGVPTAFFNTLTGAKVVTPTLGAGDTLYLDSLVTSETGALNQSVTFTLDSGVDGFNGIAAWAVTGDVGPRLVGVNIDLVDAVTNAVLASDTFVGLSGGFASSIMDLDIGPGTYKLIATGVGQRESSLDIALTFTGIPAVAAAPEPTSVALVIMGLATILFSTRRPRRPWLIRRNVDL